MKINEQLTIHDLAGKIERLWAASAACIDAIEQHYDSSQGSPVFTVQGRYTTRGWTEWTQGFQYGAAIMQFDATGEKRFLDLGRQQTIDHMAGHVTHFGVHDHGFNNVSTYGNLLRLAGEGKMSADEGERLFYRMALQCSGAVQARRWTTIANGQGYIYSFNGPHSLFADTIRSLRALAVAHRFGHELMDEHDERVSLLRRLVKHARTTADYNVYYGQERDSYDVWGRTAHESIFNLNDGNYRCPNSQQGFSPFTTWTRGLSWVMCGFPEQLEYLATVGDDELAPFGGRDEVVGFMLRAAKASCDFYIDNSAADGVVYWDTGAPDLHKLGDDYLSRPADPFNDFEPVDSSAGAIGAQGLLRLGRYLQQRGETQAGNRYWQAGLTVLHTLFDEPYLSSDPDHQGLLLHSIYHRPNGWDHIPEGRRIPCGEACMWGDYHAREAALYVWRLIRDEPYLTFFEV